MMLAVLLLVALLCVANAFQQFAQKTRGMRLFAAKGKKFEKAVKDVVPDVSSPAQPPADLKAEDFKTMNKGDAPWGKQFFQADIGLPTLIENFGGGDIGGNDYKDSLYSYGPRGGNKPDIKEAAVVNVGGDFMKNCERGFKDFRRPDGTMASASYADGYGVREFKVGEWTAADDEQLVALVASEKDGTRGRWNRISKATDRTVSDCSMRWLQVLNPNKEKRMPDIVRDNEQINGNRDMNAWWLKKE